MRKRKCIHLGCGWREVEKAKGGLTDESHYALWFVDSVRLLGLISKRYDIAPQVTHSTMKHLESQCISELRHTRADGTH